MSNQGVAANTRQIAQSQPYECTVLIWNNRAGLGALQHPGHAAVLLRRSVDTGPWRMRKAVENGVPDFTYQPRYDAAEIKYVSFWPGDDQAKAGYSSGEFLPHHLQDFYYEVGASARDRLATVGEPGSAVVPRTGQIVIGNEPVAGNPPTNRDVWGQEPNVQITLSGLCSTRTGELGLAMNEIVSWTRAFSRSPDCSYSMVTTNRNCSGVAVRALVAGGADSFATLGGNPSRGKLYFTPNDAEVYVTGVRTGITMVNHMLGHIRSYCTGAPAVAADTDLMTAAEFKTQSAVDWKVRGLKLRAIDAALEKYATFTWAANYTEKMGQFVTIIKNTYEHILASRSGSRTNAFRALGVRILEVVRQLAAGSVQPWESMPYYGDRGLQGIKLKEAG